MLQFQERRHQAETAGKHHVTERRRKDPGQACGQAPARAGDDGEGKRAFGAKVRCIGAPMPLVVKDLGISKSALLESRHMSPEFFRTQQPGVMLVYPPEAVAPDGSRA